MSLSAGAGRSLSRVDSIESRASWVVALKRI